MSRTLPTRPRTRRIVRASISGGIVLAAAITGMLVYQAASASAPSQSVSASASEGDRPGALGVPAAVEDDGELPEGVTVFDDQYAGIANLDPALLQAIQAAATTAASDDIDIFVTSGWRSREYQDRLLREAIAEYGSEAEAARWVATAGTSAHVSGDAVDLGPSEAAAWLSQHGAEYGLCQIYANEPWHYELRLEAADSGCPLMYADPTHDPRMQR